MRRRKDEKQNRRAGKREKHRMLARHAINLPNSWPNESHIYNELCTKVVIVDIEVLAPEEQHVYSPRFLIYPAP
jgi:hypothetical protein